MIERLNSNEVYNPIRDHIKMSFIVKNDIEEMSETIAEELYVNNFDPLKSRVLIFVQTRKLAEQSVELLKTYLGEKKLPYSEKVDFYHAGLSGVEREEKYDKYNDGELVILIATKAFGMGMDIKNIHYIFHLGPSSTFEDYLQEVGRAGRNKEMLNSANFSDDNPIQTICLMTNDAFKKNKDKLHKSQILWADIKDVGKIIFDYVHKFRKLDEDNENSFPLPLDLLKDYEQYDEINNLDTFFRVILYWLEKLNRIRLGVYIPTHLPLKLLNTDFSSITFKNTEEKKLLVSLKDILVTYQKDKAMVADDIIIEVGYITNKLRINTKDIYKLLFRSQYLGILTIERYLGLEITKTRFDELEFFSNNGEKSPMIEATFRFAQEIIQNSIIGDQVRLDGDYLDSLIIDICEEELSEVKIKWDEHKNDKGAFRTPKEISKRLVKDFKDTRSKFAFKILSSLPKIKHSSIIVTEDDTKETKITQLIYNGGLTRQEWTESLSFLKEKLYRLISIVSREYIHSGTKTFNIVDLMINLGLLDDNDNIFDSIVFLSKSLAYLKGEGGLVPMGVELFIKNLSQIDERSNGSFDREILHEFTEANQMKELRLITLECLSKISRDNHDTFIKEYFKCDSVGALISLLENYLGQNDSTLMGFKSEALKKAEEKLSLEQKTVYEVSKTKNLQVVAGPGSGKTHTLILRVARLIHQENVTPSTILVLAYNRAVAIELKERLSHLFNQLGYSRLINSLKVFTFHGFIKYCLKGKLDNVEFSEWTPKFLEIMNNKPGVINQELGNIKYVFIDEFQDITSERLEMLKLIANPKEVNVCVIGDPNQSIYGYERKKEGGQMDPRPYYDEFNKLYNPQKFELSNNYRSFPQILNMAEDLLSLNKSKFPMPKLRAQLSDVDQGNYCEVINYSERKVKWENKLQELLLTKDNYGLSKFKQVAVMFRTNDEVFRAFNILQKIDFGSVRLRIQGSKGSLYKSREFQYIEREMFGANLTGKLSSSYINDYNIYKEEIRNKYPAWDKYLLDLYHCLLYEFETEVDEYSTKEDLIEFIKEIANKDDGQIGKLYYNNISKINKGTDHQEIVLTTMHKVKGLEFGAVLIPASFSNLPLTNNDLSESDIEELIEEERRLYYVAYTRAKKSLITINWHREDALFRGDKYVFEENVLSKLGTSIPDGTDKLFIGWGATESGDKIHDFIEKEVSIGYELVLTRPKKNWVLGVKGKMIGMSSNDLSKYITNKIGVDKKVLKGFSVSGIYVLSYDEVLNSDHLNDTNFIDMWSDVAKKRGYIYMIDFSGYGKEI